ncbi:Tenascin [Hondaea fermentalgiana]|uniref:Tenascin n=1 Tax=Hondaea fermentalgiana TaxID=2315210 RepID=A0A2R5GQK6_9STRA|nr:Tenascin [Hondaea fermentalgiana]|eukprot:GBG32599.1 Tenascin [Hondaea fermentalgiana]
MPAMKAISAAVVLVLAVLETAQAACPNACSGHGTCGRYDACTCHVDWVGGDCSLRACPKSWAWVTTNANGDINGDGDRDDITIYDSDNAFTASGFDYVVDEQEPYGTWEQWPAFSNAAGVDEGHFYMECSNQGICDRSTGECECFEGYTGAGCRRSSCPNDCNGHGVCQTVSQQKGSYNYNLWDKDMSRSCVCDAGYSGPDCSERKCGYGDDPLTVGQTTEKQWVDIYTDYDATDDNTFAGHFRLKYTDYNGKQWTTDAIPVVPYDTSMSSDYTDAVADALNSLPNDVLSGVTVTAGYAEHVITGTVNIASSAFGTGTNNGYSVTVDTTPVRCPETAADKDKVRYLSTTALLNYDGTTDSSFTDVTDTTCYIVEHMWSVRFEITFPNQYGDLTNLEVDTSEVTVGGLTDSQRLSALVGSSVSSSRQLATQDEAGGITMAFTHPSDTANTEVTCSSGNSCDVASKVVTLTTGDAAAFPLNSRVKITCGTVLRGTFTVAATDDDAVITVAEDLADCDGTTYDIIVKQESYYFETNTDITALLSVGDVLEVDGFNTRSPKISSINAWDATRGLTHIFFADSYTGDDSNDSETTSDPSANEDVAQRGDATSEKEECSGRGLCDREEGICRCFKGYTGWACSLQNALSLGYGNE